jgi:RNA polymerase sigma factor (sigma-70 family)
MKHRVYSENLLYKGLKQKDHNVLTYIYTEYYGGIENFVMANNGTIDEAKDIFQDSLVIVYKKIRDGELQIKKTLKSYLFIVCRNLWFQKIRAKNNKVHDKKSIETNIEQSDFVSEQEIEYQKVEKRRLFETHFINMNSTCRKLLKLFLKKTSMREIAQEMSFNSVAYAKARKYQCLKKLQKSILADPCCKKLLSDE